MKLSDCREGMQVRIIPGSSNKDEWARKFGDGTECTIRDVGNTSVQLISHAIREYWWVSADYIEPAAPLENGWDGA
jgi:hypothetical protein